MLDSPFATWCRKASNYEQIIILILPRKTFTIIKRLRLGLKCHSEMNEEEGTYQPLPHEMSCIRHDRTLNLEIYTHQLMQQQTVQEISLPTTPTLL